MMILLGFLLSLGAIYAVVPIIIIIILLLAARGSHGFGDLFTMFGINTLITGPSGLFRTSTKSIGRARYATDPKAKVGHPAKGAATRLGGNILGFKDQPDSFEGKPFLSKMRSLGPDFSKGSVYKAGSLLKNRKMDAEKAASDTAAKLNGMTDAQLAAMLAHFSGTNQGSTSGMSKDQMIKMLMTNPNSKTLKNYNSYADNALGKRGAPPNLAQPTVKMSPGQVLKEYLPGSATRSSWEKEWSRAKRAGRVRMAETRPQAVKVRSNMLNKLTDEQLESMSKSFGVELGSSKREEIVGTLAKNLSTAQIKTYLTNNGINLRTASPPPK